MSQKAANEIWEYVGVVEIGYYPHTFLGFGVQSESGEKITTCTRHEYARRIVDEHNAAVHTQKAPR